MEAQVILDQKFIRKRNTLTAWFLFLLFINVGLQLECVEKFFDSKTSQTQVLVKNTAICGSTHNMGTSQPDNGTLQLAIAAAVSSANSFQSENFISNKIFFLKNVNTQSFFNLSQQRYVPKQFAFCHSGLSPPLA